MTIDLTVPAYTLVEMTAVDMLRTLVVCILCVTVVRSEGIVRKKARWCTVNDEEMQKCKDLVAAVELRKSTSTDYPSGTRPYDQLPKLTCLKARDEFACMENINDNIADLIQLDPGMGYTAGEYYTMLPLVAEKYTADVSADGFEYLAVAVVRKDRGDITIDNLAGRKSCHTGVGRAAGWVYPISTLIEQKTMPITECNVPVKSAAAFFGPMCAPNGLARYFNPFGNNPATICENCAGKLDARCTSNDPYSGYVGAFNCMSSGVGDVAFVRHSTLKQIFSGNKTNDVESNYELLCLDGTRAATSKAATCNWGRIPSHIVMTSAIHDESLRELYRELLELLSSDFGVEGTHTNIFKLFESVKYGRQNLMFTDETQELLGVKKVSGGTRDTYYTWVGPEYWRRLRLLNTCPLQQARWCVISQREMNKCENMIMAFSAKGLKPDLNCIFGTGTRDCMDKIRSGDADIMSADAADIYVAGKQYDLVPIAYEDYSGHNARTYKAVAVARRTDSHLTIFNLKGRRTCHSGVMTAAGWVVPVDKLIETGQLNIPDRNVYFHMGQFFSKSCVPGVLTDYYNTQGTNPINLCEACAAGGKDRCQRNDEELYYGNSGAFRCLTEMGGDVAFTKHTTVRENTDGRNRAEWARNRRSDDYELMCNDGTRKDIDEWANCNMGEIPANAIVTAGFKSRRQREIYWTLLNYAQQFFASDNNADFSMFDSEGNHKDLVFQDSTVRLVVLPPKEQNYQAYLGSRFVRAMQRMQSIDSITESSGATRRDMPTLLCVLLAAIVTIASKLAM